MGKFKTAEEALTLPNGARYYRCALQVNPPHYLGTYRGQKPPADERTYVRQLIEKCVELDIEVIALADHNSVSSVELFRREAETRRITVFPGFELTSREGIHILCLYSPDTSPERLSRYLGQFGIVDTDPSTKLSSKTVSEILEDNRREGGVAVAAHVTQEKGLLRVLKGQARANAWRDPNLLAVQLPGPVDEAPPDTQPILENRDSDHAREHPVSDSLAVAVINAKDVAGPADLEDPSASCWIKMS
ncbi:MAG: phosphoesterase, partial [Planctomycetota bacterium]